jgi:hypothetical protein
LQFKPHHIAAGAIFLAAKFLKVKLPSEGEKVWWQEFDVTPRQLEGNICILRSVSYIIIKHMTAAVLVLLKAYTHWRIYCSVYTMHIVCEVMKGLGPWLEQSS